MCLRIKQLLSEECYEFSYMHNDQVYQELNA